MNRYLKEARTLLTKIVRKGITLSLDDQIRHFLERTKPPSSKGKAPAEQRKKKKALQHRDSTAVLREAVFQRAGGLCEICVWQNGPFEARELHHLEGGSGRRALQRASNCVAACPACHLRYHCRPEDFREAVLAWCIRYGYPLPRRFRRPLPDAPAAPAHGTPPSAAGAAGAKEEG